MKKPKPPAYFSFTSTFLPKHALMSAPTAYRLRFYTRRFLRHFRHTTPHRVAAFLACALLLSYVYISLLTSLSAPTARVSNVPPAATYDIALASRNITPQIPVFLSGFASRTAPPARPQLLDPLVPLYARAVALRHSVSAANANDTSDVFIFIALDVIAIPAALSADIRAFAHLHHRIHPARIVVCASHTHSGPAVGDALSSLSPHDSPAQRDITTYYTFLTSAIKQLVSTVVQPFEHPLSAASFPSLNTNYAKAATLTMLHSYMPLAVNRRHVDEKSFNQNDNVKHRGATNDILSVLMFSDSVSKNVLGGIFGYSAHPTILTKGNMYSGDYPAITASQLETHFNSARNPNDNRNSNGRVQPPSMWLFASGVGGDQNIYPRGSAALVQEHATKLSNNIIDTICKAFKRSKILGSRSSHTVKAKTRKLDKSRLKHKLSANNNNPKQGVKDNTNNVDSNIGNVIGDNGGIDSEDDFDEDQEDSEDSLLLRLQRRPFYKILRGKLSATRKSIDLPFAERYTADELGERARSGPRVQRHTASELLARTANTADGKTAASYPYPLTVWKLGSAVLAFMGGEPTAGYDRLLREVGVDWVIGYCDDVMGYVGTADVIRDDGREGGERAAWYYGLPSKWSVRVQDKIVTTVEQMVNHALQPSSSNSESGVKENNTNPQSQSNHTKPIDDEFTVTNKRLSAF